jgi:hypothetical protein
MATEDLSRSAARDQVLDLIGAVARGDAERGDVTAALKDKGVDSVDDMLAALAGSYDRGRTPESLARPLDVQRNAGGVGRMSAPPSVHRTSTVPFLLRGTLYDPTDIERFQGQELHFTPAADGSHLIVVDDRSIMEAWWQLSFLSRNAGSPPNPPNPHPNPGDGLGARTIYYKDDRFLGWTIGLRENRGYFDLTEVGSWLEGDWNDVVSSVRLIGTMITVLHEHIHWTGSTLNVWQSQETLHPWGWNDRASSLETW